MAIDRQSIEKRDFPIGRRGYDPDAVDAHLAQLADEVEQLKRASSRQRGDATLATAASDQVRLIVEAAEQSAADIEREADLESRRIRQEARESAEKQRAEAGAQARDHVARVTEACSAMLERIDTMESELRSLIDGLRGGANRVSADLALLHGAVGDLRGGASGFDTAEERVPAAAPGASSEPAVAEPEFEPEPEVEDEPVAIEPEAESEPEPAPRPRSRRKSAAKPAAKAAPARPADEEGARLIALNMALNGTPRDETESYLAENFDLDDPAGLLDDVYARAGQ